jgi:hypothetical protein
MTIVRGERLVPGESGAIHGFSGLLHWAANRAARVCRAYKVGGDGVLGWMPAHPMFDSELLTS